MKFKIQLIALALAALMLSGCAKPQVSTATVPTTNTVNPTEETSLSDFLESIELTLPDHILRKPVSSTRVYFYADEAVVGGIELLDIAEKMDTMDLGEYADIAMSIVKSVYDTEYQYIAESDTLCKTIVATSSLDGKEFKHYFFKGTQMGYDVWMDYAVLDDADMYSCLKTLNSEDLSYIHERASKPTETPLLTLRLTLPEGITKQPKRTTRTLLYRGETLAGGIEQITGTTDTDALGQFAIELARELYSKDFDCTIEEMEPDGIVFSKLQTGSGETHLVHYLITVGDECYDVWADTSIITEESALEIAQSCHY